MVYPTMLIKLKCWILTLILWLGVLTPVAAAEMSPDLQVIHVLNRLSFGPRPGAIEDVKTLGIEDYIQKQLSPELLPEPPSLTEQLARLETLNLSPIELYRRYVEAKQARERAGVPMPTMSLQQAAQVSPLGQTRTARLLRAVYSPRQLQEVLVDFWYNHFNVTFEKGLNYVWAGAYEQQAIRPHVLGKFRDLLGATARHPAMLHYLDNWRNTAPDSPGAQGIFKGLNQNYARELMELHTLGVDGGYTETDVVTLAKILTGWGLCSLKQPDNESGFCFHPQRHDASDKVFLGEKIPGGGADEVERVLDILAQHPSTANHISYKLAQYFVADQPPQALVNRLAERFLATDGDIRAVLNTLFHSPEFWDEQVFAAKFKTPYRYLLSVLRTHEFGSENLQFAFTMFDRLGMPLYGCESPDGYKNTQAAWLSPDGIMRRLNWSLVLAQGKLPLGPEFPNSIQPQPIQADVLAKTVGVRFSNQTKAAIDATAALRSALILGSPEFMYH
jgi:uncharacterized protein (DUF1800 family)